MTFEVESIESSSETTALKPQIPDASQIRQLDLYAHQVLDQLCVKIHLALVVKTALSVSLSDELHPSYRLALARINSQLAIKYQLQDEFACSYPFVIKNRQIEVYGRRGSDQHTNMGYKTLNHLQFSPFFWGALLSSDIPIPTLTTSFSSCPLSSCSLNSSSNKPLIPGPTLQRFHLVLLAIFTMNEATSHQTLPIDFSMSPHMPNIAFLLQESIVVHPLFAELYLEVILQLRIHLCINAYFNIPLTDRHSPETLLRLKTDFFKPLGNNAMPLVAEQHHKFTKELKFIFTALSDSLAYITDEGLPYKNIYDDFPFVDFFEKTMIYISLLAEQLALQFPPRSMSTSGPWDPYMTIAFRSSDTSFADFYKNRSAAKKNESMGNPPIKHKSIKSASNTPRSSPAKATVVICLSDSDDLQEISKKSSNQPTEDVSCSDMDVESEGATSKRSVITLVNLPAVTPDETSLQSLVPKVAAPSLTVPDTVTEALPDTVTEALPDTVTEALPDTVTDNVIEASATEKVPEVAAPENHPESAKENKLANPAANGFKPSESASLKNTFRQLHEVKERIAKLFAEREEVLNRYDSLPSEDLIQEPREADAPESTGDVSQNNIPQNLYKTARHPKKNASETNSSKKSEPIIIETDQDEEQTPRIKTVAQVNQPHPKTKTPTFTSDMLFSKTKTTPNIGDQKISVVSETDSDVFEYLPVVEGVEAQKRKSSAKKNVDVEKKKTKKAPASSSKKEKTAAAVSKRRESSYSKKKSSKREEILEDESSDVEAAPARKHKSKSKSSSSSSSKKKAAKKQRPKESEESGSDASSEREAGKKVAESKRKRKSSKKASKSSSKAKSPIKSKSKSKHRHESSSESSSSEEESDSQLSSEPEPKKKKSKSSEVTDENKKSKSTEVSDEKKKAPHQEPPSKRHSNVKRHRVFKEASRQAMINEQYAREGKFSRPGNVASYKALFAPRITTTSVAETIINAAKRNEVEKNDGKSTSKETVKSKQRDESSTKYEHPDVDSNEESSSSAEEEQKVAKKSKWHSKKHQDESEDATSDHDDDRVASSKKRSSPTKNSFSKKRVTPTHSDDSSDGSHNSRVSTLFGETESEAVTQEEHSHHSDSSNSDVNSADSTSKKHKSSGIKKKGSVGQKKKKSPKRIHAATTEEESGVSDSEQQHESEPMKQKKRKVVKSKVVGVTTVMSGRVKSRIPLPSSSSASVQKKSIASSSPSKYPTMQKLILPPPSEQESATQESSGCDEEEQSASEDESEGDDISHKASYSKKEKQQIEQSADENEVASTSDENDNEEVQTTRKPLKTLKTSGKHSSIPTTVRLKGKPEKRLGITTGLKDASPAFTEMSFEDMTKSLDKKKASVSFKNIADKATILQLSKKSNSLAKSESIKTSLPQLKPISDHSKGNIRMKREWTAESVAALEEGMIMFGENFGKIQRYHGPSGTGQLVNYTIDQMRVKGKEVFHKRTPRNINID